MFSLLDKIIATYHTWNDQRKCIHGPWINDYFSVLGKTPSCHCINCWKTLPQGIVESRDETLEEWLKRSTEGGMNKEDATVLYESMYPVT